MNALRTKLNQNSVVATILFINVLATAYTTFNDKMADKLFELYIGSTFGLYGYANQSKRSIASSESNASPSPSND
jgi:hypothetical protein